MFDKILARLGATLNKSKLPYMIIGGQAVLLYGEPRLTRDIDITIGLSIGQLGTLLDSIKQVPLKSLPENAAEFVKQTTELSTFENNGYL